MSNLRKIPFLIATNNQGKAKEIKNILGDLPIEIMTLSELGLYWQDKSQETLSLEEINRRYLELENAMEETSDTFEGNALIKARGACQCTGLPTLADDSGLVVDYLQGAPGVYSARYAGLHGDDVANNELLLKNLKGVPDVQRKAKFVAALVLVTPFGEEYITQGICKGFITHKPKGEHGFGYDPIFRVADDQRTLAQFSSKEKNAISHRGQALNKMLPYIKDVFLQLKQKSLE